MVQWNEIWNQMWVWSWVSLSKPSNAISAHSSGCPSSLRLRPSGPSPFQPLHHSSRIPTNDSPSWGLCTHPPPPAPCPEWSSVRLSFCRSLLKCTLLKRTCLTLLFQRSTPTPQCHTPFNTAWNRRYSHVYSSACIL